MKNDIVELLEMNPRGFCISDIAKLLCVNRITAMVALAELKGSGMVDFQKVGPTKLYFLKKTFADNKVDLW